MKTSLLLFLALFSLNLTAQYTVTTFTADYANLTNEQNLGIESDWDDPFFELPLGFDFQIGSLITSTLTQDGLGSTFFTGTFNDGQALGYLEDLRDGISVGDASFITYKVDGEVGDRICKIQYLNCAFYDEVEIEGAAENRVNLQIWFYESDFSIEFRFGPSTVPNPGLAYGNLQGPVVGVFNDISNDGETVGAATYLSGNPQSPTIESNTDLDQIESSGLNGTPEDGRVYRFTPTSLSVQDDEKASFSIYPTIATEDIRVEGISQNNVRYSLTNLAGQLIETGVLSENRVDVSSLSNGMYFISIGESSQKFMKK